MEKKNAFERTIFYPNPKVVQCTIISTYVFDRNWHLFCNKYLNRDLLEIFSPLAINLVDKKFDSQLYCDYSCVGNQACFTLKVIPSYIALTLQNRYCNEYLTDRNFDYNFPTNCLLLILRERAAYITLCRSGWTRLLPGILLLLLLVLVVVVLLAVHDPNFNVSDNIHKAGGVGIASHCGGRK